MNLAYRTTVTALVAAGALAAGCGNNTTSSAPTSSTRGNDAADQTTAASSRAGGNGIDRAFVAAMVPHHQAAITMSRIARLGLVVVGAERFAGRPRIWQVQQVGGCDSAWVRVDRAVAEIDIGSRPRTGEGDAAGSPMG